jgi:hypothetical protein
LAAVSRGQEEEAVRAVREQAAAHQTFLFRLQLKQFSSAVCFQVRYSSKLFLLKTEGELAKKVSS